jgi:hypothetical protein
MRISELLALEVVDADGRHVGKVRDVRLVQDGPVLGGTQAAMRVEAVVAGGGALGIRLGYVRGRVRGPALLGWAFSWAERRADTFLMTDLDWDADANVLRVTRRPHS